MNNLTIQAQTVDQFEQALNNAMSEGAAPTLGIIFCSTKVDQSALRAVLKKADIPFLGCTTSGEIFQDKLLRNSIAGLFFSLPPSNFQIVYADPEAKGIKAKATSIAQQVKSIFADPAIMVLAGGMGINGDRVLSGFRSVLGDEVSLFGGLAGDSFSVNNPSVFSSMETTGGLVALVVDQTFIEVKGLATSGWAPIGLPHTITSARGNVVYTIDDKPALDVFVNYFGFFDDIDMDGNTVSTVSAQYPLQLIREDGTHILRSPLIGNEDDGSLILAGGVKEGQQFRFSISPGFEVIDQVVAEFGDYQQAHELPDAMVLFSCVGRNAALGPLIEDEIKGISSLFQCPMVGFLSFGEFGSTKDGPTDFHNETCSLVTFRQKKAFD